jgi:BlaI family transcriptional regulator, penicillinase repressor
MPKKPAEVTDTELAILDVLWEHDRCEIRDLVEAVYGQHTAARHATIKSLLERLMQKGFVACDRSRFAHRFSAVISREGYVGQQLQKLADSHFEGSLAPMLLNLIERSKLSRRDLEAIRKIVEKIE